MFERILCLQGKPVWQCAVLGVRQQSMRLAIGRMWMSNQSQMSDPAQESFYYTNHYC